MTGHVFVVQGDLTRLVCDEVLIPTDRWLDVGDHWDRLRPLRDASLLPRRWHAGDLRVTDRLPDVAELPHRRMVNSGATELDDIDWLMESIEEALAVATAGLAAEGRCPRRGSRLLALPVLGSGAGGYGTRRGEVLDGLLTSCRSAARDSGVDIAVVCYRRSDFTAVQARRSQQQHHEPSGASAGALARDLGRSARTGSLALFLGAGVSVGAGLPGWRALLEGVAASDERTAGLPSTWATEEDLWGAASALRGALGEPGLQRAVDQQLSQRDFALSHALLASLPGREAVTTNFDELFESARSVRTTPTFDVLPYRRGSEAYLLKLHGDSRSGDIVLDEESLTTYDERSRPLAGLLQGLMLTRHLLFVGCSMKDANVLRNVDEVAQLVRRYQHRQDVGTVLTLLPDAEVTSTWSEKGFAVHAVAPREASQADAARALEVFLDTVLLEATYDEGAHLLDPLYAALLDEGERPVADELRRLTRRLPKGRQWEGLRRALVEHGGERDARLFD